MKLASLDPNGRAICHLVLPGAHARVYQRCVFLIADRSMFFFLSLGVPPPPAGLSDDTLCGAPAEQVCGGPQEKAPTSRSTGCVTQYSACCCIRFTIWVFLCLRLGLYLKVSVDLHVTPPTERRGLCPPGGRTHRDPTLSFFSLRLCSHSPSKVVDCCCVKHFGTNLKEEFVVLRASAVVARRLLNCL